jgi:spore maturation protein CgeB
MKIVVFGLTITSSWGNGHATLWRGLLRALARRGWKVVFFERDTSYYAQNRDLRELGGVAIHLYSDWSDIQPLAASEMRDADVGVVSSYCPDAERAGEVVLSAARGARLFYDLDTPVTLGRLQRGEAVAYVGPRGFQDYDLVLSYTGGLALDLLRDVTGARRAVPLYGHVDPEAYAPTAGNEAFRGDLSYIGTYAPDRQQALDALFLEPARRRPERRFVLAGAQYPADFAWSNNVYFVRHLPPPQHPAFYGSSRLTLNVTRRDMAAMGWCPSGRLFEAASCGACLISDNWDGLDAFFTPGEELIIANGCEDTLAALELSDAELRRIGEKARARVVAEHTSERRAEQLEAIVASARDPGLQTLTMSEA